jgi:hypothetical protein
MVQPGACRAVPREEKFTTKDTKDTKFGVYRMGLFC